MTNITGAPATPDTLTVIVHAPRTPQPRKFTWKTTTLVGQAADEAAKEFEYQGGTPSFQNNEDRVLDRAKTLPQEGVQEGGELELVETAGGV